MKVFRPGDPEPDVQTIITYSGRWYKNGRGWQHELALTDMGDCTWEELLETFGAAVLDE